MDINGKILNDGFISSTFDETQENGFISINDLLQKPFEKFIGSFEIPEVLKEIVSADEVNASIDWYLSWKLREPIETQNTCTIKRIFGYTDGIRVIISINLYKYLRNKDYDPEVVEKFISKVINK